MTAEERIRTFIAVDLTAGVRRQIRKLSDDLQRSKAPVAWVKPDNVHLTLKFLGDVPLRRIKEIENVLADVVAPVVPFRLQPAGCGAFPSMKQMRVVWVGLRGAIDALATLQKRVEEALIPLGFETESRPFKAHLTLGRVKGQRSLRFLQEALVAHHGYEAEAFDVTEVVLYKSVLKPKGAHYTPLFRAVLGGQGVSGVHPSTSDTE